MAYELANRGLKTCLIDTDNIKKDVYYYINEEKVISLINHKNNKYMVNMPWAYYDVVNAVISDADSSSGRIRHSLTALVRT